MSTQLVFDRRTQKLACQDTRFTTQNTHAYKTMVFSKQMSVRVLSTITISVSKISPPSCSRQNTAQRCRSKGTRDWIYYDANGANRLVAWSGGDGSCKRDTEIALTYLRETGMPSAEGNTWFHLFSLQITTQQFIIQSNLITYYRSQRDKI